MLGQQTGGQDRLFHSFNLEDHVPANHLLRGIDQFLDLHDLRSDWHPFKNPRSHITKADTIIYRSSQFDCSTCLIKPRCCPNTLVRKITRSLYEPARDVARAIGTTQTFGI